MPESGSELEFHRDYYRRTASAYDTMNVHERDEHSYVIASLAGQLDFFGIKSVLEVGAGTGRLLLQLRALRPNLRICGVEPVAELRQIGYQKGLSSAELRDGSGYAIPFEAGEFDLVACFGVLHHVAEPPRFVREMMRVATKGVLISDSNNFGQGGVAARMLKQTLRHLGLWRTATWIQTRGRGYHVNESDGLFYSYSVFDNFEMVKRDFPMTYCIPSKPSGPNLFRSAGHVAILGLKDCA
jgi:ubiquinone/menaquinone biosynthesis C-methylase UbiE